MRTNTSSSFGSTNQDFRFGGVSEQGALGMEPDTELHFRSVASLNGVVTRDEERLGGKEVGNSQTAGVGPVSQDNAQRVLDRRPGFQGYDSGS